MLDDGIGADVGEPITPSHDVILIVPDDMTGNVTIHVIHRYEVSSGVKRRVIDHRRKKIVNPKRRQHTWIDIVVIGFGFRHDRNVTGRRFCVGV